VVNNVLYHTDGAVHSDTDDPVEHSTDSVGHHLPPPDTRAAETFRVRNVKMKSSEVCVVVVCMRARAKKFCLCVPRSQRNFVYV
jgi:hypothetical protein